MRRTPLLRKLLNETSNTPVRRCILTGIQASQSTLVRLALGPDGMIAPDVRAKAPGRGAWIGIDRSALCDAQSKGKLRGALARAFKGETLSVPDDLPDKIEVELKNAVLSRLGLESRSGFLITGSEKISTAAHSGQVYALCHANDASLDGRKKLDQAWRVGSDKEGSGIQGIVIPSNRNEISAALGKDNAVHIAIIDRKASQRLMHHLSRWLNFTGCSIELDNNVLEVAAVSSHSNQDIKD